MVDPTVITGDVVAIQHPTNVYKTLTHPTPNATNSTPLVVSIPYWTDKGQFTFVHVNSPLNMNFVFLADQTKKFLGYNLDPNIPNSNPLAVYVYFIKFRYGVLEQELDPKWAYATENERDTVFHELYAVISP